jgi:predicted Zn finger-like uncharacterized protein
MSIVFKCNCGASYRVGDEQSGKNAKCAKCGQVIQVPAGAPDTIGEKASAKTATPGDRKCPICLTQISDQDSVTDCPDCNAAYHAECWQENGGCGVYGCPQVPETDKLSSVEIPVSFWGREDKPCPVCNAVILASAVRCRHCGATFKSARPEGSDEYVEHKATEEILPKLRRGVIWLLVLCVIPFTAPIAAVIGFFWYWAHRDQIKVLPRLYSAISGIAICLGIAQTVFVVLATFIYAAWNA